MKSTIITLTLLIFISTAFSQNHDTNLKLKENKEQKEKKERANNWGINLLFSDNGFGFGATKYLSFSEDISGFGGIFFGAAKDDREFEQTDIYGNTFTPYKQHRLFLAPVVNLGMHIRLFREDVTDNMRPFITFGLSPTAIIYTPYNESFFSSFGHARAKYTLGGFAGIGVEYLSSKTTALSFNIRYYYLGLFGEGIRSLETTEKKQFGGIYFVFGYNFLK
jgi:hypothetical protein